MGLQSIRVHRSFGLSTKKRIFSSDQYFVYLVTIRNLQFSDTQSVKLPIFDNGVYEKQKKLSTLFLYFKFRYYYCPFVHEVCTVLDWMWSDSSLTIMEWFKMEELFAHICCVKVNKYNNSIFIKKKKKESLHCAMYYFFYLYFDIENTK